MSDHHTGDRPSKPIGHQTTKRNLPTVPTTQQTPRQTTTVQTKKPSPHPQALIVTKPQNSSTTDTEQPNDHGEDLPDAPCDVSEGTTANSTETTLKVEAKDFAVEETSSNDAMVWELSILSNPSSKEKAKENDQEEDSDEKVERTLPTSKETY